MSTDTLIFNDTSSNLNVTTNIRRRRCGFCRCEGHDRRTCPEPDEVENRRLRRIRSAEVRARRRSQYLQREQERQERIEADLSMGAKKITLHNHNRFDIAIFFKYGSYYKHLLNILKNCNQRIKYFPQCEIIVIPVDMFEGRDVISRIDQDSANTYYKIVGEYNLDEHDSPNLYIISDIDYSPKTELEQWKECGLKSIFLLKQLDRLGASKNENYESIMDMIQDIRIPSYTPNDCENAGIPSVLTNIT